MATPANLALRGFGAVLVAVGVLAAGPAQSPRHAVDAPAASFACNQPVPAAGPGRVTLAGVGYGPYHAGQDPNFFISPSAGEVAADMPTLAAVTNYIRIYSSTGPAAEIVQAAQAARLCVSLGICAGPRRQGECRGDQRRDPAGQEQPGGAVGDRGQRGAAAG